MKTKKFLSSDNLIYFIVGILSATVFLAIYGIRIINPLYTDWLMGGDDLTQHYIGWIAYRYSKWHFPIGMVDNLAHPNLTSVIFTDSIPLFAFFFKILSPLIPANFQYFGIWGLFCFILQGIITAKIIKKYTNHTVVVILCSMATIFTPVMIFRMFVHTALAGQWVVLLGLDAFLNYKKYAEKKRILIYIAVISFLSSSIHMYFVLMNGIILLGICIISILENKKILNSFIYLLDYLLISTIVNGLLGGFSSRMDITKNSLGKYSFNLNGFVNPQGWSCILHDKSYYWNNLEGFAYLGIGFLFLNILCFLLLICTINKQFIKNNKNIIIAISIVFLVSFFFALSPKIVYGNKLLFELKLPDFLYKIWSIFRASGRVIWICIYLFELLSFIILLTKINRYYFQIIILCLALIFQIYDFHHILLQKNAFFSKNYKYTSSLETTDFWSYLESNPTIEHIVFYSLPSDNYLYSISNWAINSGKTVNNFYFARSIDDIVNNCRTYSLENPSEKNIYVFPKNTIINCLKYPLHYYLIDGLVIGYVHEINGQKEISNEDYCLDWVFENNLYIGNESGKDIESGREIYPNGFSFGPYWQLPSGKYLVTIYGSNLPEETEVLIYSNLGQTNHKNTLIKRDNSKLVFEVLLEQDVENFEVYIKNNSNNSIIINSIHLQVD